MEFRNLPFELWKVALYENSTISLEKVKTENDHDDDIDTLGKDSLMHSLKSYSEDEAFKNTTVDLKTVYEEFKIKFNEEYTDGDTTITKTYIGSILMEKES